MRIASLLLIVLFGWSQQALYAQPRIRNGIWGGTGVQLTIMPRGGSIDYGCDSGTIEGRFRADSSGKFHARGTHVFGTGGPRGPGSVPSKFHHARFEAVKNGDVLELNVLLPELNRKLGPFKLKLGEHPLLERCG